MKNQHEKIKGYRDLSQEEIDRMNAIKEMAEKIKGYRDLSQEEIDRMNAIKGMAEKVGQLVEDMELCSHPELGESDPNLIPDPRWLAMGKSELQKGFMFLVRSVAKPGSF